MATAKRAVIQEQIGAWRHARAPDDCDQADTNPCYKSAIVSFDPFGRLAAERRFALPLWGDAGMPTFTMFIRDERYAVPTVDLINAANVERAAQIAKDRLVESRHHLAVELCEDDQPLARFDRDGVLWFNEAD